MAVDSRETAAELITKLRKSNGAISSGALEVLERDFPDDLESVQQARRKLGAATRTLATNLYSTDTRFVYELIQNAEDNSYSRAASEEAQPFLNFILLPDCIVIDSNEDGFQAHDVAAICSTGESTKKASGYIGEKGIGFKSVFKVARKVHIQSEPFSFAFEYDYDSDDNGLGMVTPNAEGFAHLPEAVQTRMILTLLDPGDFDARADDLRALPDTLLLFLGKLRALSISIQHADGTSETWHYTRETYLQQGLEVILKKRIGFDGEKESERKHFLVIKRTVDNLPYHSSRKGVSRADTVLAFPVTAELEPVVQQQHVFAYLPLRQVGFKFLIQSDFVTQASREDIFVNSRNEALLEGVAETFRDAVLQFVHHNPLQYQWMRYLPDENISDQFWAKLRPKIHEVLRSTSILRSWSGIGLFKPTQLRYLTFDARDTNDDPLFADLREEVYLAKGYDRSDHILLEPIGCKIVHFGIILDRVAEDLRRDPEASRMKSPETSEDWHCRAAKILVSSFKKGSTVSTDKLKALPLIPLNDGNWTSAEDSPTYFPDSGPCDVPHDIGIALVKASAVECKPRKELFVELGVKNCDPQDVIDAIYRKHRRLKWGSYKHSTVVHHMQYLYHHLPGKTRSLDNDMKVVASRNNSNRRVSPSLKRVYFNISDDVYGADQLFRKISPEIPGLPVWILLRCYNVGTASQTHELSWIPWLEQDAGIRSIPPSCEEDSSELSKEFKYLATYRPDMLLKLLQKNWFQYVPQLHMFREKLKRASIPSANGEPIEICEAYVPLPEVLETAHRFGLGNSVVLPLASELFRDSREEWKFLEELGVRFTEDLDFYLKALQHLSLTAQTNADIGIVFEVYAGIEEKAVSADDCSTLRSFFQQDRILLPTVGEEAARWVKLKHCRWSGPDWLESKHCLASNPNYLNLSHLFTTVLRVKDADHHDWLEELEYMKARNIRNIPKVSEIYRCLLREFGKDTSPEYLRDTFEKQSLVFAPRRNDWFPPSACVWADEKTTLMDMASVSTSFAGLEEFFCKLLGIPKPSVHMRVETLKDLAKKQKIVQIKAEIMAIAALNPSVRDLKSLRKINLFYVRAGSADASLTNSESDWVIVDRKEYADAFEGQKIHVLDYSMSEVQKARQFLEAMRLEKKFMSMAVEEKTMVEGGALNTKLTIAMKAKAYALYRCAVHFGSSKLDTDESTLFGILSNLMVYESDHISKSIQLTQYGTPFTVERSRSNIHFEEYGGQLKLYVPVERRHREVCYFQQLPREMLKFLSVSDRRAEAVFKSVIGASSLDVLDDILVDEGILEIDGVQRPPTTESPARSFAVESSSPSTYGSRISTPTLVSRERTREGTTASPILGRSSPFLESSPSHTVGSSVRYAEILSHVISAGQNATIPESGTVFQNAIYTEPPLTCTFSQLFFPTILDRDKSVGAAGELFVFELLMSYDIPGFNLDNWQSGIRHLVQAHDDYSDLAPWLGRETADITYHDMEGELTEMLIDNGYLEEGSVTAAPWYYLEVKTTTGACGDRFYMSSNQYDIMEQTRLRPATPASEIMIVFRVFNIDRPNLGLKLFVDPDAHRRNGTLDFRGEKWIVRSVE